MSRNLITGTLSSNLCSHTNLHNLYGPFAKCIPHTFHSDCGPVINRIAFFSSANIELEGIIDLCCRSMIGLSVATLCSPEAFLPAYSAPQSQVCPNILQIYYSKMLRTHSCAFPFIGNWRELQLLDVGQLD